MAILAGAYKAAGKPELSLPLQEQRLNASRAVLGPEHPDTLDAMQDLAEGYQSAGKLDLALPLLEETVRLREAKLGPEHPATRFSQAALVAAYQSAGRPDRALPLFEERLKHLIAKLGPDDPETLAARENLSQAYQAAGKPELALPFLEERLKLCRAKFGPESPEASNLMYELAQAYQSAGKPELALPLLEERLRLWKTKIGPEHPATRSVMNNLAFGYLAAAAHQAWFGRDKDVAATCQRALDLAKGSDDPVMLELRGQGVQLVPHWCGHRHGLRLRSRSPQGRRTGQGPPILALVPIGPRNGGIPQRPLPGSRRRADCLGRRRGKFARRHRSLLSGHEPLPARQAGRSPPARKRRRRDHETLAQ